MKKKSILTMLTLASVFLAITSCKKEEQKEPLKPGDAQISGRLIANLDETNFQDQPVPEGTGITFVISGEDLDRNPQPGYNYEDVVVRAEADADGYYSASLPAVKNSITVDVIYDEFEFDAEILTTNDDGFQEVVTERRTFSRASGTISIVEGQVLVKDYMYNTGIGTFVPSAILRGEVEAQLVDNVGEPTATNLVVNGTNYPMSTYETEVNTTGGTGSGLTVDYQTNASGEVVNMFVNNPGSGYTIGDLISISDGDGNATFEIMNVTPKMEAVPQNVLLTFTVGGTPYKVVTNASGEYLVKLPAGQGGANVQGADFETSSVYFENTDYVNGDKIYTFNNVANQNVLEGSIIELDLTYSRSN